MTACALRRRSERSHKGRRRRTRDLPASLAAMASDIRRAIDAVYRIESARLIAGLTRMVRDVGLAEDLAQDALVAALEQWPESGIPDNPGAWLMTTEEIARAFLVPVPTIAQRVVRAKRTLAEARVPFEVPEKAELTVRLSSVLEVIYLVFNEGYAATGGDAWTRPELCEEALRLGRVLAGLLPKEPEVWGLVALMEIQASRLRARVGPSGEPILLLDQDRGRWDQLLIRRGLAALKRAEELSGALGPYALQAAIAACHARARTPAETDWARIMALYDALAQIAPSPVVELNRAVAVGMAFGPAAG